MSSIRTLIFAALVAVFSTGIGCAFDDDSSVVILYNSVPSINETTGACTTASSDSGVYLSRGLIDSSWPQGYLFFPLVKNYAVTSELVSDAQRLAFVDGADITLRALGNDGINSALSDAGLSGFSQRFSATVSPNGGTTGAAFVIIPREALPIIGSGVQVNQHVAIQAKVQLFGLLGGGNFRSQEYEYWVDVCDGCGGADPGQSCGISAE